MLIPLKASFELLQHTLLLWILPHILGPTDNVGRISNLQTMRHIQRYATKDTYKSSPTQKSQICLKDYEAFLLQFFEIEFHLSHISLQFSI